MPVLQRPQPRPGVLAIDPYVPGRSTAPGTARVFKLSSNETPLGPSERAIAAYRARRWDESERAWRQVLERHPADTIAQLYVERIQRCRLVAPAEAWDGAVELEKL